MFIKYSTHQIPPKNSRGKGSQGKKTTYTSIEEVDVSEEFEPEPAKKRTASKRRVKKKVTISAEDNIISDDPDTALELGKSISQTKAEEAEEAEEAKKVLLHMVFHLLLQAADIMQALKESKKYSRRQLGTGGSNEGTGSIPRVLDESTVVSATSSEGTGIKPGVPDEEKDITKAKVILEWGDEQDSEHYNNDNDYVEKDNKDGDADDEGDDHVSVTQDADDEDDETESDEDEIYKYKIRVRKDEDEEIENAEVEESDKGDEEVTDAAKEDAEKTLKVKDDTKKTKIPPTSSSLSVSLGFGDQFLKFSFDSSLVSTVKDSAGADVSSLIDIPIQQETPQTHFYCCSSPQVTPIISSVQQTPTPIPTQPITTDAPTVTTAVLESNALTAVELRVAKLEKDIYLDSKVGDVFQKELQKHTADLIHKYLLHHLPELTKKPTPTAEQESKKSPYDILKIKKEQAEKQKKPHFTIKSTDKANLEEYDLKSALYQSINANKLFNKNPANH
ncbi:hypothetical protein Tco_0920942 [Tanacetum coccineum]